jgi:predicted nucleic acid-binding protein
LVKANKQALIVADAGPLIALGVAQLLPAVLAHFGRLWVPQAVLDECTADISAPAASAVLAASALPGWCVVAKHDIAPLDAAYAQGLGSGEVAVLGYALQHHYIALIDERRARGVAARLGVPVVGSGAVLLALKAAGRISSIKPAMAAWQAHGYFVAPPVAAELLKRAGEA